MNPSTHRLHPIILAALSLVAAYTPQSYATTFNGNGNNGFGGDFGGGSMSVTNDGLDFSPGFGYVDFSISLANGATLSAGSLGNNLVIYLDNGKGGGITSSTSSYVTSPGDGGESAVTQNSGSGNFSILNFGGLMAPQYAIELDQFNFGQIYSDTGGVPTEIDGASSGDTTVGGLSFLVSGSTASINIPDSDFGLTGNFPPTTINLASLEVSASGYSSNEGTEQLTGNDGYQTSGGQTLTGVDSFTVVPEPSTVTMMLSAGLFGSFYLMRRRRK